VDLLPELLKSDSGADLATLAVPIQSREQWQNPNCVKVVCASNGRALYFSRSPIPFVREGEPRFSGEPPRFLQHLGLYAYRKSFLLQLAGMPPAPLEEFEKLEQLRVLFFGRAIQVGIVRHAAIGVDTPEDYARFVEHCRRGAA
jgi:3-deoxy-manno-octulosonate cytidylyltransferase (CMP-KDO synthetase)